MSSHQPPLIRENPFSTRNVRPGAVPFVFPEGTDGESLLQQFARYEWRAAIVGPHGTGKSTLLATLIPVLERSGKGVIHFELHDGQRRLPATPALPVEAADRIIVIDGYEQLSWWNRKLLEWRCRQKGWGLLVTSHVEERLPTLFHTSVDVPLAQRIVRGVLPSGDTIIREADVREALANNAGNLREALFALYDLYELRCSER